MSIVYERNTDGDDRARLNQSGENKTENLNQVGLMVVCKGCNLLGYTECTCIQLPSSDDYLHFNEGIVPTFTISASSTQNAFPRISNLNEKHIKRNKQNVDNTKYLQCFITNFQNRTTDNPTNYENATSPAKSPARNGANSALNKRDHNVPVENLLDTDAFSSQNPARIDGNLSLPIYLNPPNENITKRNKVKEKQPLSHPINYDINDILVEAFDKFEKNYDVKVNQAIDGVYVHLNDFAEKLEHQKKKGDDNMKELRMMFNEIREHNMVNTQKIQVLKNDFNKNINKGSYHANQQNEPQGDHPPRKSNLKPFCDPSFKKVPEPVRSSTPIHESTPLDPNHRPVPDLTNAIQPTFRKKNQEDWASILLKGKVTEAAAATSTPLRQEPIGDSYFKRYSSKKIILPKFDLNRGITFRQYLNDFESVSSDKHDPRGFAVLLGQFLEGEALDIYENLNGPITNYEILKTKMIKEIERIEGKYVRPTVPAEISYNSKDKAYGLAQKIATHLSIHGDTQEIRHLLCEYIEQKLPDEVYRKVLEKAYAIADSYGKITFDLNDILQACSHVDDVERDMEKRKKNQAAIFHTESKKSPKNNGHKNKVFYSQKKQEQHSTMATLSTSEEAGNNHSKGVPPPPQKKKETENGAISRNYGNQANGKTYTNRNYGNKKLGGAGNFLKGNGDNGKPTRNYFCTVCASNRHNASRCPKVDHAYLPTCKFCGKDHNWVAQPCTPPPDYQRKSNYSYSSHNNQKFSASFLHYQNTKNPKQNCENEKNCQDLKNLKSSKWLALSNLDELQATSQNTNEQNNFCPTFSYSYSNQKSKRPFNHKRNSRKNQKNFLENENYVFLNGVKNIVTPQNAFEIFEQEFQNASRKKFFCKSNKCNIASHVQATNTIDKAKFTTYLLEKLKMEFPSCELATYTVKSEKFASPNAIMVREGQVDLSDNLSVSNLPSDLSNFQDNNVTHLPDALEQLATESDQFNVSSSPSDLFNSQEGIAVQLSDSIGQVATDVSSHENSVGDGNTEIAIPNNINSENSFNASSTDFTFPVESSDIFIKSEPPLADTYFADELNEHRIYAITDLMLVKVNIGKATNLIGLIDTGAAVTSIDSSVVDLVGGQWEPSPTNLVGLGGTHGFATEKSLQSEIYVENIKTKPLMVYTMPAVTNPMYQVLLGRDFFSVNDVTINPKNKTIDIRISSDRGDNSIFSIYTRCRDEDGNLDIENPSKFTMTIPCYARTDQHIEEDEVSKIKITTDFDLFYNTNFFVPNTLAYLEIDSKITGIYPNCGVVHANNLEQEIDILADKDYDIYAYQQIGTFNIANLDELPSDLSNNWQPNYDSLYTILSDQQISDALNSAEPYNNISNNPTAIFDEIPTWGSLPMKDTPSEYALGHHARVFPPRDMQLFEQQHQDWLADPCSDNLPDEWSRERIVQEFKLPENELSFEQKEKFYDIIQKYRVAFSRNDADLGLGSVGEIDLVLKTDDHSKLKAKPSKWSPESNELIKKILEGYLKSGIIKPGTGPYASRVFVTYRRPTIEEPNPKPRLVIDYREINKALVPCSRYLAGVDSLLLKVKNHLYYSKLDLKGAYHQIGILEDAKDISAIIAMDSQYVFNVMSFGLCIAPGYFEIFMDHCFRAIPPSELAHFLDDCIIPSDSIDDMLIRLEKFLYHVTKNRMKVSAKKCSFFSREIMFLGFVLSKNGIKKSQEYIDRILKAPKPRTVHELMKFMGLVNFQRRFIRSCSELTKPLTDAIDHKAKNIKKKEVHWNESMEKAFNQIKIELAKDVALAFPETSENASPLELYTDASNLATGSALFQLQQGELRPLSFMSKLLSKTEIKYTSYDKEILALVRGITSHRQFLIGRKFKLFTDCKNVVCLFKMKNCSPRLLRLLEQLAEYDFEIYHIAGVENYVSDMLSHLEHYSSPDFFQNLLDQTPSEYIPDGLVEVKVPGGAESPFDTISYCLKIAKNLKLNSCQLRDILVKEILSNPTKYDVKGKPNDLQDLRGMLKEGVATYIIVFQAAANIYKLNFFIYFGFEQPLVFAPAGRKNSLKSTTYPDAYVLCKGQGCHFNPLIGINDPANAQICHFLQYVYDENVDENHEVVIEDFYDNFPLNELIIENPSPLPTKTVNCREIVTPENAYAVNVASYSQKYLPCETAENDFVIRLPRYHTNKLCQLSDINPHYLGDFSFDLRKNTIGQFSSVSGGDPAADLPSFCVAIDTGSTISLVSESAHKALYYRGFAEQSLKLSPQKGKILTLGGQLQAKEMALVTFPFWLPQASNIVTHLCYILPDQYCSSCFLLGADFVSQYNVQFTFDNKNTNKYLPTISCQTKDCTMSIQYPVVNATKNLVPNNQIFANFPCTLSACLRVDPIAPIREDQGFFMKLLN